MRIVCVDSVGFVVNLQACPHSLAMSHVGHLCLHGLHQRADNVHPVQTGGRFTGHSGSEVHHPGWHCKGWRGLWTMSMSTAK